MAVRIVQFLAIVLSALALIPAGAHLAALPNKMALPQADYFTVQGIYRGWALLGLLWAAAIAVNILLAFLGRQQTWPFWCAVLAALCLALTLVVFFLWTFPANRATENWTTAPQNWESLRQQWEYSHAANTVIVFVGLCFTSMSALSWRPV